MKELRSFSSAVLPEIEKYYKDKKIAKKSGNENLIFFVNENSVRFAEMIDELKLDIKDMMRKIEKLKIHLDDIYNFKNRSTLMLRETIKSSKKLCKTLEKKNNQEELKAVNGDIESSYSKLSELKKWYSKDFNESEKIISLIEDELIKAKTLLSKVEKRRLFDLRPTHMAAGIAITFFTCLIAGLLINYLYLMPLKGVVDHDTFKIIVIIIFALINVAFWFQLVLRHSFGRLYLNDDKPMWKGNVAGFISAFSDTLGIGSYAMATATFKITRTIKPHELKMLPGTLSVGLAFSQMFAGILFLGAIKVDPWTLLLFCGFTVIGTFAGSFLVEKLHRKVITFVLGAALFTTVILLTLVLTDEVFPSGDKTGLTGAGDIHLLLIGLVLFFGLGVLMSFGVGLYAPSMVVISLLGLDPITSIPIMTCAAALSQQTAALKYAIGNHFIPKVSFNMVMSGMVGVLAAFVIVFVLIIGKDVEAQTTLVFFMRCISVVVVLFASVSLLINYFYMKQDIKAVKLDKQQLLSESSFTDKFNHFVSVIKTDLKAKR